MESHLVFDEDGTVGVDHHLLHGGIAEPFFEGPRSCDMRNGATGELVMFVVAEERCSATKVHLRRSEEIAALVTKLMSERSGESVWRGHSGCALEWVH